VRAVQGWKEVLLAVLGLIALRRLYDAYGQGRRPLPADWLMGAFALVLVAYLVIPGSLLPGHVGALQRLLAFRTIALIPLLYVYGRALPPAGRSDLFAVAGIIVGANAAVGLFGLFELWLMPTYIWLNLGVNQFTSLLGFSYVGPSGLPENFFQSLPDGLLLRRMVSTYISPLGIAYTGLLVLPAAVLLIESVRTRNRNQIASAALALILAGILFSLTRLALFVLVAEVALIALVVRRLWLYALTPVTLALVLVMLFAYPLFGPTVDRKLLPVLNGRSNASVIYAGDPSSSEHLARLLTDSKLILKHPLGSGLGTAVRRFATEATASQGTSTGESAVLGVFLDVGVAGGVLYVVLYALIVLAASLTVLRSPPGIDVLLPMTAAVGGLALVPITMTSDVWGDFSVTFLFWWAAGASMSLGYRAVAAETVKRGFRRVARPAAF
jgi:hypothetical protein